MTARKYAETEVDRNPTRLGESATVIERNGTAGLEQLDLVPQAIGNGHVAVITPELAIATARPVVQDDEIPDRLVAARHQPIVFLGQLRLEATVREKLDQPTDTRLHEMDAGGLERLEESAREPEGHTVSLPTLAPAAGGEFDEPGCPQRRPIEVGEERCGSLVFTDVAAAEHIAVASAVLQRNPPLPT